MKQPRVNLTLRWIKADLKKYWATWIGFSGLVVIGLPLFIFIATPFGERLLMMLICWLFCCTGLFLAAAEEKAGYISDEERSKPYDEWEGLSIRLPYLPTIRWGKKEQTL